MNRYITNLNRCLIGAAVLSALSLGQAQTLIVPQIADGGGWQTTLVLTNATTSTASASLTFYQDTSAGATQSWNPTFLEVGSTQSLSLSGGGTLFLHTPGTASVTSQGWAQLQASAGVTAYAIFTQRAAGGQEQDGTAPAAASASRILVPFDNTNGFVTSIAIANATAASESVSVGIQPSSGASSQPPPIMLPALGQMAFALPQQFLATGGQSGLLEFYAANGSLSVLALRFNPTGAFTAAPVYQETGPPIIGAPPTSGGTPAFTSLLANVTFQPMGHPSGGLSIGVTPNAGNTTYTATVGIGTVLEGTASNQNQTFAFNSLTTGSFFVFVGGIDMVVSSASLTFTLAINPAESDSEIANGSLAGTFSVTLTAPGGGTPVTLSGAIVGTYSATLPPQ